MNYWQGLDALIIKDNNMLDIQSEIQGLNAWVLSDGKAGHRNQSIGVAEALGISYTVIELKRRKFGTLLSLFYPPLKVQTLPKGPYPDIVIGAGNLTAPVTKWIKMQNSSVFTVQMMTPLNRFGLKPKAGGFLAHLLTSESDIAYDVVASPIHEGLPNAAHIVHTVGAPNRITEDRLVAEKETWAEVFAPYKGKRIAVLVGGTSKRFMFDEVQAKKLTQQLNNMLKREESQGDVSLLITTSRRTGEAQTNIIKNAFAGKDNVYVYTAESSLDNPFFGMLAWADAFVVTAESTSMVSEACSVGKPVYLFGLNDDLQSKPMGKFNRFYNLLKEQGRIAPLGGEILDDPEQPLMDTEKVASFIRAKILQRLYGNFAE
jgi:mitochondrial fission protein ELM1